VYDSTESKAYTVTDDLLVKVWDIVTEECLDYIILETREDQTAKSNQNVIWEEF
jgi:hypothetical protein